MQRDLKRGGYYHRHAFEEFAALRNAAAIGWLLLVGLLIVAADVERSMALKLLAVGIFGSVLWYGIPALVLRSKANARVQRIGFGLPDALDMLTMCMAGGLPLQRALGYVGTEMRDTHTDLARELRIVWRQMETGTLDGALAQFAQRINAPDVQTLATMVRQTDLHGGSVSAAFEQFGDGLRLSMRQRAEERGNKTSIKLLLPLVFCLAPPVYLLLLTPAAIELSGFVTRENQPGGILTPATLTEQSGPAGPLNGLPSAVPRISPLAAPTQATFP